MTSIGPATACGRICRWPNLSRARRPSDGFADRVDLFEGDRRLPHPTLVAVRNRPSVRSLVRLVRHRAVGATLGAPLPFDTDVVANQALLDTVFEYPIGVRHISVLD
jgi:hypothetical protein